jgi:hypothetical protein
MESLLRSMMVNREKPQWISDPCHKIRFYPNIPFNIDLFPDCPLRGYWEHSVDLHTTVQQLSQPRNSLNQHEVFWLASSIWETQKSFPDIGFGIRILQFDESIKNPTFRLGVGVKLRGFRFRSDWWTFSEVTVWKIKTTQKRSRPHGWPCWAPDRSIHSHSFKATGWPPHRGWFISDYPPSQSPLLRQISCPVSRAHPLDFYWPRPALAETCHIARILINGNLESLHANTWDISIVLQKGEQLISLSISAVSAFKLQLRFCKS